MNAVAGLCIFLFLLLQYEEKAFDDRGISIQEILKNDSFKVVTDADQVKAIAEYAVKV